MKYSRYLATTAISDLWDMSKEIAYLGPWCLSNNMLSDKINLFTENYIPSPWFPISRREEAYNYCYAKFLVIMPEIAKQMNFIHKVSYPERYWRILVGPWLGYFISAIYDRYKRIERAVEVLQDFKTHVVPLDRCNIVSYNMEDLVISKKAKMRTDYYNLILFSLVAYELCKDENLIECDFQVKTEIEEVTRSWKRQIFHTIKTKVDKLIWGPTVLTEMYHLDLKELLYLKYKVGIKTLHFIDCINSSSLAGMTLEEMYSAKTRDRLKFKFNDDRFMTFISKLIPKAIPVQYVEEYSVNREKIKSMGKIRVLGTAGANISNEFYKFLAAESILKNAKLLFFQHGSGHGAEQLFPSYEISSDFDISYTWGVANKKYKRLPSAHLSRIRDKYALKLNKLLFVGTAAWRYQFRFNSLIFTDDILKYFNDKALFLNFLSDNIKIQTLYRSARDLGWGEIDYIKTNFPMIKVLAVDKSKLVNWMKKIRLLVIDHSGTSLFEALTINVPTVFFWNQDLYRMRSDIKECFNKFQEVGVLFSDPVSASRKVNEIYHNPLAWWHSYDIQQIREEFCERFAYSTKEWINVWAKELKSVNNMV